MPAAELARVKRAAERRRRADAEWRAAIRDAVASGDSLRAVAEPAGISHVRVLQLTHERLTPVTSPRS